jgi:phospholipid/cholesterol/gamma-HCH transport system substrate-binding protein
MARFELPRFREIPVLKSATIGVALIVGALLLVSVIPSFPWVRGHVYKAVFTDSGGLKKRDEVRVAGIPVGEVISTELVGNTVEVEFSAKNVRMAKDATAAIKTGTLLGKRYLGIEPGNGAEMEDDLIPVSRTSTPYNVSRSIEDVSAQMRDFDKQKIEDAMNTFADAFQDTPANFRATFKNLKELSLTINTRDQALRELLAHANAVSGVLSERTDTFVKILQDGTPLLAELQRRQSDLHDLFLQAHLVIEDARLWARENKEQLGPVLDETNEALKLFEHNNDNIELAIRRAAGFIGGLGEGVGDGPGFHAGAALWTSAGLVHYTDVLRQLNNPQAPRVPAMPCGPGGLDTPNPLYAPPSGANAQNPQPPPSAACGIPADPGWNGKTGPKGPKVGN